MEARNGIPFVSLSDTWGISQQKREIDGIPNSVISSQVEIGMAIYDVYHSIHK